MTDTPGAETRWLNEDEQNSWRALMIGMTLLLDRLDDDAIDHITAVTGTGPETGLVMFEIRHIGGAAARSGG